MKKYIVSEEYSDYRLDKFISIVNNELSRVAIQRLINEEKILVNKKFQKPSYKVRIGEEIQVGDIEVKETELKAQNLPIEVIYEDTDIIVVNKPKNMVVHPANRK